MKAASNSSRPHLSLGTRLLKKCLASFTMALATRSLRSVLLLSLVLILHHHEPLILNAHSEDFATDDHLADPLAALPKCKRPGLFSWPASPTGTNPSPSTPYSDSSTLQKNPCLCFTETGDPFTKLRNTWCRPNYCISNEIEYKVNSCQFNMDGNKPTCKKVEKTWKSHTQQINCSLDQQGTSCKGETVANFKSTTRPSATNCEPCKVETPSGLKGSCNATDIEVEIDNQDIPNLGCTFVAGEDGYKVTQEDCNLRENRCSGSCKFEYLTAASECKEGEEFDGICLDPSQL